MNPFLLECQITAKEHLQTVMTEEQHILSEQLEYHLLNLICPFRRNYTILNGNIVFAGEDDQNYPADVENLIANCMIKFHRNKEFLITDSLYKEFSRLYPYTNEVRFYGRFLNFQCFRDSRKIKNVYVPDNNKYFLQAVQKLESTLIERVANYNWKEFTVKSILQNGGSQSADFALKTVPVAILSIWYFTHDNKEKLEQRFRTIIPIYKYFRSFTISYSMEQFSLHFVFPKFVNGKLKLSPWEKIKLCFKNVRI